MAGATAAIMQKVMAHDGASKAMAITMQQMAAAAEARTSQLEFRPGAALPER